MVSARTGPASRFSDLHVWRALFSIKAEQPIGRKRLAAAVGVGEGSMRSILAILCRNKLARPKKPGMVLTAKGKRTVEGVGLVLAQVNAGDLTIGPVDAAAHIRGGASNVRKGIEQRDDAIKAGAIGATTIICRGTRLIALEDIDIEMKFKPVAKQLRAVFEISDGDAVILCTADAPGEAENGALSAALSLLDIPSF
jgi:predicted transcriptional regulator